MLEHRRTHESAPPGSYLEHIYAEGRLDRRPHLHYDRQGRLCLEGLPLPLADIARAYDTPLQIIDTRRVIASARRLDTLLTRTEGETGYAGGHRLHYATKANSSSEIVAAVLRSGVMHLETSTVQDLLNILRLTKTGLVDPRKIRIICNGFKLPSPQPQDYSGLLSRVHLPLSPRQQFADEPASYADLILKMRQAGFQIMPILDTGETDYFIRSGMTGPVGLRLKFGKVANRQELAHLCSRFGFSWNDLRYQAAAISRSGNLRLEMLHTMVGAAETIAVEDFVNHLLLAADHYFELKKSHSTLRSLNIGGGVPPFSENYDHARLFQLFLAGVKDRAVALSLPEPQIVIEPGSLVAAESAMTLVKSIQLKSNHIDPTGRPGHWAVIDGSVMGLLPDTLLIGKSWDVLAAERAHQPPLPVVTGGITCDSDDCYPSKPDWPRQILIPQSAKETILVVPDTGAYQGQLSGVGGVQHCQLREPTTLIIETDSYGRLHYRVKIIQSASDISNLLGYTPADLAYLRSLTAI